MEATDDDDENLGFVKASLGLLADLENGLHRVLRKRHKPPQRSLNPTVHSCVKKRDLDWLLQLV